MEEINKIKNEIILTYEKIKDAEEECDFAQKNYYKYLFISIITFIVSSGLLLYLKPVLDDLFFYVLCGLDVIVLSIVGCSCAKADREANKKYEYLQELEIKKFELFSKYKSTKKNILENGVKAESFEVVRERGNHSNISEADSFSNLEFESNNKILIKKRKNSL